MPRKKVVAQPSALTCGWCMSGMHERCSAEKWNLPCLCSTTNHKEATPA